jgi:hypothetical protein
LSFSSVTVNTGLRRTVFQTLGKDIQAVMITVSGQTNIAQGKEVAALL